MQPLFHPLLSERQCEIILRDVALFDCGFLNTMLYMLYLSVLCNTAMVAQLADL